MMTEECFNFQKWNVAVGQMIAHMDNAIFPRILADAIHDFVSLDKLLISKIEKDKVPAHIYDSGIAPEEHELHFDRYYSGAYLLDPVYQSLLKGIEPGFYHLKELSPDNFDQSEYYLTHYKATGIVEDVLYLVTLDEDTTLSIELGRGPNKPPYSEQEKNRLRMVEPIVQNVAKRHWGAGNIGSTAVSFSSFDLDQQLLSAYDNFGKSILTKREIELTHLMLKGYSIKSAAEEMMISSETIKMHRKNLYAKLKISGHPELFSLFISSLSCISKTPDKDPLTTYFRSL